jgi:hypothetical protein
MADAYIELTGWTALPPPPDVCKATEFYCFGFPADRGVCQDFLDQTYNRVAARRQFRVLLDLVFLTIVKSARVGASAPPYSLQGTMAETDIGFWLLAGNYDEDALFPKSIGWVPAYLFVDNPYATAGGREIWGFPKIFATMNLPDTPRSGGPFEVSALAFQEFGPDAQASIQQVMTLQGNDLNYTDASGPAADIFKLLCAAADSSLLLELIGRSGMPGFLGTDAGVPVSVFYLKQFRSAASPTDACYQALLQGPLVLTQIRACGLLTGDWELELFALDSLAFIRNLGLGAPADGKLVLKTKIGFWCDIDIQAGDAEPIA